MSHPQKKQQDPLSSVQRIAGEIVSEFGGLFNMPPCGGVILVEIISEIQKRLPAGHYLRGGDYQRILDFCNKKIQNLRH